MAKKIMSLEDVTSLDQCYFKVIDLEGYPAVEIVTKDFWNANQYLNDDGNLSYILFPMFLEEMEAVYSVLSPGGTVFEPGEEDQLKDYVLSLGMELTPEEN